MSPYQANSALQLAQQPYGGANKNSGQFYISQLCSPRSPFPITRRVEGATLSASPADTEMNCTITFRTKSAQQHFVVRFEELKLSCDDHLVLFDGDLDYGQPSIKDFSCRDNMASAPTIKTTGTFLTLRYSSDGITKMNDGFRLVVTAVFDMTLSECPSEYVFCRSQLCISRSLFCDGINHCLDNSDEIGCQGAEETIELPHALAILVMLLLIIVILVSVCLFLHHRRDSPSHHQGPFAGGAGGPYAALQQFQQAQMQRALGGAAAHHQHLHASSSFMYPPGGGGPGLTHNHHPYQQFFQAAGSPYVTPQHQPLVAQHQPQALIATLPRGYSTLPLNLVRAGANPAVQQAGQPQAVLASKAGAELMSSMGLGAGQEFVVMAAGPHQQLVQQQQQQQRSPAHMLAQQAHQQQPAVSMAGNQQTPLRQQQQQTTAGGMASSQSILSSSTTATTVRQRQAQIRSPPSSSNASQTTRPNTRNGH